MPRHGDVHLNDGCYYEDYTCNVCEEIFDEETEVCKSCTLEQEKAKISDCEIHKFSPFFQRLESKTETCLDCKTIVPKTRSQMVIEKHTGMSIRYRQDFKTVEEAMVACFKVMTECDKLEAKLKEAQAIIKCASTMPMNSTKFLTDYLKGDVQQWVIDKLISKEEIEA